MVNATVFCARSSAQDAYKYLLEPYFTCETSQKSDVGIIPYTGKESLELIKDQFDQAQPRKGVHIPILVHCDTTITYAQKRLSSCYPPGYPVIYLRKNPHHVKTSLPFALSRISLIDYNKVKPINTEVLLYGSDSALDIMVPKIVCRNLTPITVRDQPYPSKLDRTLDFLFQHSLLGVCFITPVTKQKAAEIEKIARYLPSTAILAKCENHYQSDVANYHTYASTTDATHLGEALLDHINKCGVNTIGRLIGSLIRNHILLAGPRGCGKSTTLRALCAAHPSLQFVPNYKIGRAHGRNRMASLEHKFVHTFDDGKDGFHYYDYSHAEYRFCLEDLVTPLKAGFDTISLITPASQIKPYLTALGTYDTSHPTQLVTICSTKENIVAGLNARKTPLQLEDVDRNLRDYQELTLSSIQTKNVFETFPLDRVSLEMVISHLEKELTLS